MFDDTAIYVNNLEPLSEKVKKLGEEFGWATALGNECGGEFQEYY